MPKILLAHLNFIRLGGGQHYLGDSNSNTTLSLRARTCMLIKQLVLHVKLVNILQRVLQDVPLVLREK